MLIQKMSFWLTTGLLAGALTLSGCASVPEGDLSSEPAGADVDQTETPQEAESQVFGAAQEDEASEGEQSQKSSEVYRGTGELVNMPEARPGIELNGDETMLNFEKTPLEDVVHGILGDILKVDYIIEGNISGKVTIRSQAPMEREQLLAVLETMLQANDAKLIESDERYIVTSSKTIGARMPRLDSEGAPVAGFRHVIVPLEYIGAQPMADILKPVATDGAFLRIDTLRNLLILSGTRTQLDGWLDIIETFDVDYLSGMSVAIFPIEYSTVEEVTNALGTLLQSAPGDKGTALTGLVRVEPLETLGSILVVTPKGEYLDRIETWIERLDRSPEVGAEPQLFVYPIQNGTASHLADLISRVYGGSGGTGNTRRTRNEGVSPGLTSSDLSSQNNQQQSQKRTSQAGAASFDLDDDMRIVADEVNNTLLIHATTKQYRKIEKALKRLDVMPSQILIEASIIEVRLENSLQYGLEWYFDNELGGGWTGDGNVGLSVGSDGSVEASLPSFGYAFNNSLGQVQAVLTALADKDLLKVLSTPSIMVMDNQSASIQVGDSTPILSSTTQGNFGSTQNITYRDTGVQLNVTPSVNAGGLVTMDLQQSVTEAGSGGVGNTPSFFERSIQSRVAVRSGESVVLGGLISDTQTNKRTGLPFLSDLPLIGGLFGGTTIEEDRQELLVIITPHVMKTDQDIRQVNSEMRSRMKGLEAFQRSIDPDKLIGQ